MILNTGARTDTVQFYSEWLLKRFEEGYVYTRNPLFTNKVTRAFAHGRNYAGQSEVVFKIDGYTGVVIRR